MCVLMSISVCLFFCVRQRSCSICGCEEKPKNKWRERPAEKWRYQEDEREREREWEREPTKIKTRERPAKRRKICVCVHENCKLCRGCAPFDSSVCLLCTRTDPLFYLVIVAVCFSFCQFSVSLSVGCLRSFLLMVCVSFCCPCVLHSVVEDMRPSFC